MLNYYEILELRRPADSLEIKMAFKRLALIWHPDKNPGSIEAEEKFKLINEAYQVLSNYALKKNYDDRLDYIASRPPRYSPPTYTSSAPNKPYGYDRPRTRPVGYIIDKEYFRVQKIILLIFFGLIASAYGLSIIRGFIAQKEAEALLVQNKVQLDSANYMFSGEEYEKAISIINRLIQNNVTQYTLYNARDSMIAGIRDRAVISFQAQDYVKAEQMLELTLKYEVINRWTSIRYLSLAKIRLGQYKEALGMLNELLAKDPDNLTYLYHISLLYMVEMKDALSAAPYLSLAKEIFKKSHTEMYGSAFEMVVKPENIPDIYFDVFNLRSKINLEIAEYEEAYTDCNWAIFIRPEFVDPYEVRIVAGIQSGELSRICRDLNKVASMGGQIDAAKVSKYCN